MFWNKIPKGYVETVDGYMVKESETKKVVVAKQSFDIRGDLKNAIFYRKENAPNYEYTFNDGQYFKFISVDQDGTPIGYHTQEEVQKLKDRIKELEDKYENDDFIMCCDTDSTIKKISFGDAIEQLSNTKNIKSGYIGKIEGVELYTSKPKNKRGRPKNK